MNHFPDSFIHLLRNMNIEHKKKIWLFRPSKFEKAHNFSNKTFFHKN